LQNRTQAYPVQGMMKDCSRHLSPAAVADVHWEIREGEVVG